MTDFQIRLTKISQDAEALALAASNPAAARIAQEATRLSAAARKMQRATEATVRSIPTVSLSRFVIASEEVLTTMQGTLRLLGHGREAESLDLETELSVTRTVNALSGTADAARDAAVQALRSCAQVAEEMTSDWKSRVAEEFSVPVARIDELSEPFLSDQDDAAPDTLCPSVTKRSAQRAFLSVGRLFARAKGQPNKTKKPISYERHLSDEMLNSIMSGDPYSFDKKSHDAKDLLGHQHSARPIALLNPLLTERGLIAEHCQCTVSFMITQEPPRVMSPVWSRIADELCADADALRKALLLRDDQSFKSALKDEIVRALNVLTEQALAGSPGPHAKFSDPVLAAAAVTTLMAPRLEWFQRGFNAKTYDPFGLADRLRAVSRENPGLDLKPTPGGFALAICNAPVSPKGVSETLHASVSAFKAQIRRGESLFRGLRVNLPEAAAERADAPTSLIVASYLYGEVGGWDALRAQVSMKIKAEKTQDGDFLISV